MLSNSLRWNEHFLRWCRRPDSTHPAPPQEIDPRQDEDLTLYQHCYPGVTRGMLGKQDPNLYQRLRRKGLLDAVPTRPTKRPRRTGGKLTDPLGEYQKRHPGMTRWALKHADPYLYDRLRKTKLLWHVPKAERRLTLAPRAPVRKIDDLLGYYDEHYEGLTRGQLAATDFCLYRRILHAGLIDHIPTARAGMGSPTRILTPAEFSRIASTARSRKPIRL